MENDDILKLEAILSGVKFNIGKHTEAYEATQKIYAKKCKTNVPAGILITGPSGAGKTTIASRCYNDLKRDPTEEDPTIPVIYVNVSAAPTLKGFVNSLLECYGRQYCSDGRRVTEQELTRELLKKIVQYKTELILIDESQHLVEGGSLKDVQKISDWIKNTLSTTSIAMFGINTATQLLKNNCQLRRRIKSITVKRYCHKNETDISDFINVIKSFARKVDMDFSEEINDSVVIKRLVLASDGIIGQISLLMTGACVEAFSNKSKIITLSNLEKAFIENIWPDVVSQRNPFSPDFEFTRLINYGEPFYSAEVM